MLSPCPAGVSGYSRSPSTLSGWQSAAFVMVKVMATSPVHIIWFHHDAMKDACQYPVGCWQQRSRHQNRRSSSPRSAPELASITTPTAGTPEDALIRQSRERQLQPAQVSPQAGGLSQYGP